MVAGRYDDAHRHLSEAHDLAERFGYAWLATFSQVQLGILAVARGRLDEARALLDEGLAVSLAGLQHPEHDPGAWPRSPGWRSPKVTSSGRRCWPGRPRACGGGPAWQVWPAMRPGRG